MGAVMQDRLARFHEMTGVECEVETLEELLQRVGNGEGLMRVCEGWSVPYGRVMTWLMADVKRYEVYLRALEMGAHREVEEAKEIADKAPVAVMDDEGNPVFDEGGEPVVVWPDTARDKLRIDTRFRRAKAHAAGMYGDRQEISIKRVEPSSPEEVRARIEELERRLGVRVVEGQATIEEEETAQPSSVSLVESGTEPKEWI